MAVVGREAWLRQQERVQAMDTARSIPSSTTTTRLLSLATQMTAILHQLELPEAPVEDDCRMIEQLVTSASSLSVAITEALAVAILLRSLCSKSIDEGLENKDLGIWNTWKSSSSQNRNTRVLAAIEKLGWEEWIPRLLPWLPHWDLLGAELLSCSTSPHLSRFLLTSLAQHIDYALLGCQPQEAIPAMKGLDSYLLKPSLAFNGSSGGGCGGQEVRNTLIALEKTLDGWLSQHLKTKSVHSSNSGSNSNRGEEIFQTACQLRTRIALVGFSASSTSSSAENENEQSTTIFEESPEIIEIEEMKSIWERILYLHDPHTSTTHRSKDDGTTRGSGSRFPNRFAIGLAAHAAISALFLQTTTSNTLLLPTNINRGNRDFILTDSDPTSPARMTLAALRMLEQAATASRSTRICSLRNRDKELEKKKDFFLYDAQSLKMLPLLIWAVSSFVKDLQQKQQLLDIFLGSSDEMKEATHFNSNSLHTARALLLDSDSTIALVCFRQWALKESFALSNLVRTDEVLSKIKVLGEEQPGMDAAVHAVFPAALLCPDILLKVLLDGAAGQRGKAMLLIGILQHLPTLKSVKKPSSGSHRSNSQLPMVLELLKTRLQSSSTCPLDEDQRSALQQCIVTLCTPSPTSSLDPAYGSSSSSASSPAVAPDALIEYAVLPALQHAAATPLVEGAQELAMLFKLSRLLLQSLESTDSSANSGNRIVYSQLSLLSFKFLDFSSRRIDLNPLGLLLPQEVIEEAYAVAQICSRSNSNNSSSSGCSSLISRPQDGSGGASRRDSVGNSIWERNDAVCNALSVYIAESYTDGTLTARAPSKVFKGFEPNQIRDALVVACAVMLPCCATEEASALYTWLREAVNYTLVMETASLVVSADKSSFSDGAVIEVLCRAVHAMAFIPGLIPIAGEEVPISNIPSQLRCRAVGRLLQHLGLASQAAIDPPVGTSSSTSGSIKMALIARIFKEISRCAASLTGYYDSSSLHVCLMQLIHGLKQEMAKTKVVKVEVDIKASLSTATKLVDDSAITASVASILE